MMPGMFLNRLRHLPDEAGRCRQRPEGGAVAAITQRGVAKLMNTVPAYSGRIRHRSAGRRNKPGLVN
jgi:hypothetical protein